jgi:hypothetical protein
MSKITLWDAKKSLEIFIGEARWCAKQEKGFSAMLTTFPVILAVGEAETSTNDMEHQLDSFVSQSPSYRSWLLHGGEDLSKKEICDLLYKLRNALAHNASTPENIYLVKSLKEAEGQIKNYGSKKFVGVIEFIDAVESYVQSVLKQKATVTFDPRPRAARRPARVGKFSTVPMSGYGIPEDDNA